MPNTTISLALLFTIARQQPMATRERIESLVLQLQMIDFRAEGALRPSNLASVRESPIDETKLIVSPKLQSDGMCNCSTRLHHPGGGADRGMYLIWDLCS